MTKKELAQKAFNAGAELTLDNPLYKEALVRHTVLEVQSDLMKNGDITSGVTLDPETVTKARIISNEDGVLCGMLEVSYLLSEFGLEIQTGKNDSDPLNAGDFIAEIYGKATDIFACERVLLNVLMRMSGIATYAKKLSAIASPTLLLPTRKTLWGVLDKRACACGNCGTHRLNLSDAILIKDNHLDLSGRNIENVLKNVKNSYFRPRFVEIEVESALEAQKAFDTLKSLHFDTPVVIMFDNMSASEIRSIIAGFGESDILFEASGGINESSLVEYASSGVDAISMSALTLNAPPLDFSLEVF